MATNLDLKRELIDEALRLSKHKTIKAVVTEALEEFIRNKKQAEIINLFGTIDFDPKYDYKSERSR